MLSSLLAAISVDEAILFNWSRNGRNIRSSYIFTIILKYSVLFISSSKQINQIRLLHLFLYHWSRNHWCRLVLWRLRLSLSLNWRLRNRFSFLLYWGFFFLLDFDTLNLGWITFCSASDFWNSSSGFFSKREETYPIDFMISDKKAWSTSLSFSLAWGR